MIKFTLWEALKIKHVEEFSEAAQVPTYVLSSPFEAPFEALI